MYLKSLERSAMLSLLFVFLITPITSSPIHETRFSTRTFPGHHPNDGYHHCSSENSAARDFFTNLFSAVALDNFGASFAAALSDNLSWTVTGSSPIAGTYSPKSTYISQVLTPLRQVLVSLPVPIVDHIFVDDNWGVVNWHSEGVRGKNGANYDMQYCWLMRVDWEQDSQGKKELKIVEVKGFYDGQKVAAVFEGYDLNQLRNSTSKT